MSNQQITSPAGYVTSTAIAFANPDGSPQLVAAGSPLPVSATFSATGTMNIAAADGAVASLGGLGDAAATSDAGSFSLIALTKRLLGKLSVGQKPMASSLAVAIASDQSAVPVTASALPLPAGAATAALQSALNAQLPASPGQKAMAASLPVTIASDQSAVPVAASALPLPAGAATAALQSALNAQLPASPGQKAMAASLPVTLASDQTNLEPGGAPITGTAMPTGGAGLTGWLSAIYKACAAAIPAGTAHIGSVAVDDVADALTTSASVTSATTVVSVPTQGFAGGSFHVTSAGTTCTITYEQSNDNVNWVALPVVATSAATSAPVLTTAAAGIYAFNASAAYVRARVSTYTSGTVTIALVQKRVPTNAIGTSLAGGSAVIGSVAVSALPALAAGTQAIGNTNMATGYTDSTTALAASATYTGTGRTTNSNGQYAFFNASAYADQAGTLYIDQSLDTGSTYQPVTSVAVAAGATGQLTVRLTGAYAAATLYRVRFVNGATAQTTFRIASSFTAR